MLVFQSDGCVTKGFDWEVTFLALFAVVSDSYARNAELSVGVFQVQIFKPVSAIRFKKRTGFFNRLTGIAIREVINLFSLLKERAVVSLDKHNRLNVRCRVSTTLSAQCIHYPKCK